MVELDQFSKRKEFLICVDSDGCAMDTMDIKHFKCFGPCMITEWELEKWQDEILTRWNEVNLYTMTRGINRFTGLAKALTEVNEKYCKVDGIEEFSKWVKNASQLSNTSVEEEYKASGNQIFAKALAWSHAVNESIDALPDDVKKPFEGVLEGLAAAHEIADVAVVSSANKGAVIEEWNRCGLMEHVDVICAQDAGTKAICIGKLKDLGYAADHILMVGDAPGDKKAAESNGVYFYPILVRHEKESWEEFKSTALCNFTKLDYSHYQNVKNEAFVNNLN